MVGTEIFATVHSVQVDQALLTAVMLGVLRPPVPLLTHVAVPSWRMLALLLLLVRHSAKN